MTVGSNEKTSCPKGRKNLNHTDLLHRRYRDLRTTLAFLDELCQVALTFITVFLNHVLISNCIATFPLYQSDSSHPTPYVLPAVYNPYKRCPINACSP